MWQHVSWLFQSKSMHFPMSMAVVRWDSRPAGLVFCGGAQRVKLGNPTCSQGPKAAVHMATADKIKPEWAWECGFPPQNTRKNLDRAETVMWVMCLTVEIHGFSWKMPWGFCSWKDQEVVAGLNCKVMLVELNSPNQQIYLHSLMLE